MDHAPKPIPTNSGLCIRSNFVVGPEEFQEMCGEMRFVMGVLGEGGGWFGGGASEKRRRMFGKRSLSTRTSVVTR